MTTKKVYPRATKQVKPDVRQAHCRGEVRAAVRRAPAYQQAAVREALFRKARR